MKVSPVVGTPTIPNPSATGLAPEKIERLKAIASGKTPEEIEEVPPISATSTQPKITMNTNRTVHRNIDPLAEAVQPEVETAPDSTISDTDVQANAGVEATKPLSPQFAALARQRRALQVKERELSEKEKALGGATRSELEARIKSQPLSVLQELGVTYDQLTNEILAAQNGTNPDIQALKEEIKALKEGVDKTFTTRDEQQEMAVLNQIADEIDSLVKDGDDYETIRESGYEEKVLRHIYDTYKKTGQVIDTVDALKTIESQEFEKEKAKFAKMKKLQATLAPQEVVQPHPSKPGIRTLTNKDSARPSMNRRQRAILAMQGQLLKG